MEPECQTPREREKLSPSGPRWQFQPAQRGFPTLLSRVEGRGTGGPHARPDLGSRHEPCTPIDLLFSKPLLRAPLCQALITGDEAVPQQDKGKNLHLKECAFSDFLSRLSGGTGTARGAGCAAGSRAKFAHSQSTSPRGPGEGRFWEPGITSCTHGGGS